jgi:hypothetical protein
LGQQDIQSLDEVTDADRHSAISPTTANTTYNFPPSFNDVEESMENNTQGSRIIIGNIDQLFTENVHEYLSHILEYNFPIFNFAIETQCRPLTIMSHQLVIQSGLLDRLELCKEQFMNFIFSVESGYRASLPCMLSLI